MNNLPIEIEEVIKSEAGKKYDPLLVFPESALNENNKRKAYIAGATKWALIMEEFGDWYLRSEYTTWHDGRQTVYMNAETGDVITTSELLTLFIQNKTKVK